MNQQHHDPDQRTSSDEAAIRKVVEAAQQHQSDLDELMALHTDDAIIVNLAGRRVIGKHEISEAMGQALQTPLADVITTVDIDAIRFVSADVAVVACTKHVSDQRQEGANGDLPSVGRLTYVVAMDQGAWRIGLAQTTPIRTV